MTVPTGTKQARSRTGCRNCRRKKRKCDETKPTCFNCVKTSETCVWGRPLSFLPQNSFTIPPDTPTVRDSQQSHSNEAIEGTSVDVMSDQGEAPLHDARLPLHHRHGLADHESMQPRSSEPLNGRQFVIPAADAHMVSSRLSTAPTDDLIISPQLQSPTISSHRVRENSVDFRRTDRTIHSSSAYPFDRTVGMQSYTEPMLPSTAYGLSPDLLTDDGIFIPGSTYHDLHTSLRDHVFHAAQSQDASRAPSPSRPRTYEHDQLAPMHQNRQDTDTNTVGIGNVDLVEAAVTLDPAQEYLLWKNWVDEIADWLDKFDKDRHFGRTLPVLAKTCPHLKYSMLALSARQLERKNGSIPGSLTLALYSAAVHLLIPQLHRQDVNTLASCTVICVLEMMSCSPKAWRRHLDGCACLVRSMNIHADSGGLRAAIFWCFMRMDMCGGLISQERTLIPISEWTPQPDLDHAVSLFSSHDSAEWSAGYACYLVGSVLDLLFDGASDTSPQSSTSTGYTEKWTRLFSIIEAWYDARPDLMLPIVSQATSEGHPFPTLLFGNGAAISGNQLHHTAALLMLQRIPRHLRRPSTRSTLWHARRICAIAICNEHHGCWTNSIQPLWLAGQVMSHSSEHKAIVDIYARIEKETGWGAMWRANDLNRFWGDMD